MFDVTPPPDNSNNPSREQTKHRILAAKQYMEQSIIDLVDRLEAQVDQECRVVSEQLLAALEANVRAYEQLGELGESPQLAAFEREKLKMAQHLLNQFIGDCFERYRLLKTLFRASFPPPTNHIAPQPFLIEPTATTVHSDELEYNFQTELERLVQTITNETSTNITTTTNASRTLLKLVTNSPAIFNWLLNYPHVPARRKLLLLLATSYFQARSGDTTEQITQRQQLIDLLLQILNNREEPDSLDRLSAIFTLSNLEANEAIPTLIKILLTDSDNDVRRYAAMALGKVGGSGPDTPTALLVAISSSEFDEKVRLAALQALAGIGNQQHLLLLQQINSGSPSLQEALEQFITQIENRSNTYGP